MRYLDADTVLRLAPMPSVITQLEEVFRGDGWILPDRQVLDVPPSGSGRLFLTMPAFDRHGAGVVKLVTVFPDNAQRVVPTIQAGLLVFSEIGTPVAILDGTTVTRLRTGAASGLASRFLSRADSAHLVVIGTGALAPYMAWAHCTVRPITRVSVWGRSADKIAATIAEIRKLLPDRQVDAATSLEDTVAAADIVSCATRSASPVLSGRWLKPGAFVDLVGSFSPAYRESDDAVVLRSRIFVDTLEGAMAEAGDLLDPLSRRVITRDRIEGDLFGLARGQVRGRLAEEEITLFKSVGTALEDLATAQLVLQREAEHV